MRFVAPGEREKKNYALRPQSQATANVCKLHGLAVSGLVDCSSKPFFLAVILLESHRPKLSFLILYWKLFLIRCCLELSANPGSPMTSVLHVKRITHTFTCSYEPKPTES